MSLGQDPNAVLGRFVDKQRRQDQFSEDIRKVVYGGSQGRVRSPGLAAGAALALGATPSAASNAHAANLEGREQCRQAMERARQPTCPFDDHIAFGASPSDRTAPVRMPALEREDVAVATKEARNLGKHNRDIAQKVGAGAPFDAPFDTFAASGSSQPAGRRGGMPPSMPARAAPVLADAIAEARAEAAANKTRMRGYEDLLGGYLMAEKQEPPARRNSSLPPRPMQPPKDVLLPQGMMKLQYDGGSIGSLTCARASYLNSKVLAEANRDRNQAGVILG